MSESNARILIVEDEEKIAEVVKSYLEKSGFKVSCAYNGKEALELFEKLNPRLILLDLMLPDMTGEDICRTIRRKSRVPIIMLTAKVEEENILNGLGIGADDYITKPFSPKQLVARVIALLRRSEGESMPLANVLSFNDGELVVDSIKHEIKKDGQPVNLTPNEYKILMALVKYPQKAFTRDELVYLVLGEDYEGYDRTIDTHVKNLRQKIEPDVRTPKYVMTVYGVGYKFGGE